MTLSQGEDVVELAAALAPTSARSEDIDAVTQHLARYTQIEGATWTVTTET